MEIYADDPYNLPPKGPADLSLPAVYHTAENAFLKAKSLSEKIDKTSEKIEEAQDKFSQIWDVIKGLQESFDSLKTVETNNNLSRIWDAIKGVQESLDNRTASHQTPLNEASIISSPPNNTREVRVRHEVEVAIPSHEGTALSPSDEAPTLSLPPTPRRG